MLTWSTASGEMAGIQNRPYSGWFVLGKLLLWLYNLGFMLSFAIVIPILGMVTWTGQPLDVPEWIVVTFSVSGGMTIVCGELAFFLVLWIQPKRQARARPRREARLLLTVFVPVWGFRCYRELIRISDKADRRMFQFSLRTMLKLVVVVCLLASYGSCYYEISRAGMAEAELAEMEGFFYVPMDDIVAAGDVTPRHLLLLLFFAPANIVDHYVFGSPVALGHAPLMRLT